MASNRSILFVLFLALTAGACGTDAAKFPLTWEVEVADFGLDTTLYVDGVAMAQGTVMDGARRYALTQQFSEYGDVVSAHILYLDTRDPNGQQVGMIAARPGACGSWCENDPCTTSPITSEKLAVTSSVEGPVTSGMVTCGFDDGSSVMITPR
jgi:hypothetical protein